MAPLHLLREKFFWLIAISILGITAIQYFCTGSNDLWELERELYYFPIFIAAMRYGRRGALISLGAIYLFYVPFIVNTWHGSLELESARIIDLFFYLLFAFGAGYLADRDKRIRTELERNRMIISLGRITSGIVHDLKNPLVSIIGLLERLSAGKGDCAKYVPIMLQDALRMKRIVNDVLDFARPVSLKKELCNLSEVVENAVKMCREKAMKAGVKLQTELEEIYLQADPFLLERALVNVISNAIEASKAGGEVHISLKKRKKYALITVRDRGQGMDKETLDHCFDPYFSKKASGNGLGLPITKKIVEAHGGTVAIDQPVSGGTAFKVYLPI